MNRKKMLFISLALVLGLGTMMMMKSALHKSDKMVDSNMVEVLVASNDIPAGQFLQPQQVRWQPWAKAAVTEAFIKKNPKTAKDDGSEYMGAVARSGIRAGEPILIGGVVKPQDRGFLSAVLNPGMRAVAAPITNVTGIAGFVFPGDHVDLILTHTIRTDEASRVGQRRASVTIVKNARVLALDQNTNDQNTAQPKVAKVVTMEVDPKQAEVVTLALQLGTLSLSLRSLAEDTGKGAAHLIGFESSPYTLDSDVSELIPAPRTQDVVSNQVVRVLRGKEAATQNFAEKQPAEDSSNGSDKIDETVNNQ